MKLETAFTMDTSSIKYGKGVTREIGYDMEEQGSRRVMVVTDSNLGKSEPVAVTLEALHDRGIDAVLYDQSSVEPTDVSFKEAIAFALKANSTATSPSEAAPAWTPAKPPTCTRPIRRTS